MKTESQPSILDSYHDKHVLVIGATGFLGKVIVEKLLREAPGVARITLLVRRRRAGDSAAIRVEKELFATPLFRHLRNSIGVVEFDERTSRVKAVAGDITQPFLGLDAARYRRLADSVDLVINSAASVNFREALDQAMHTNMHAADRLANFAERRGTPILHISTCYVNGVNRGVIAEENRTPRRARLASGSAGRQSRHAAHNADRIIKDLENCVAEVAAAHGADERTRNEAMVSLGQEKARQYGWNDCYTMTKWLAEQRLLARRPNGPLTLLRPSIIESTWLQPFGGWLEGIKVADAVIYAYAKRGLSMFPGNKNRIIDVIPADIVANSALLAGAELLTGPAETHIYQCSSSTSNPLTIGQLRDHVVRACRERYETLPRLFASEPKRSLRILPPVLFNALTACVQTLMRCAAILTPAAAGSASRAARFSKMKNLVSLYAFYASPDYVFCNQRLQQLHSQFPASDRARLPVDTAGMDWQTYIGEIHLSGLHRFALKRDVRREQSLPPTAVPAAVAVDAGQT